MYITILRLIHYNMESIDTVSTIVSSHKSIPIVASQTAMDILLGFL